MIALARCGDCRDLHSRPTRRSSDLDQRCQAWMPGEVETTTQGILHQPHGRHRAQGVIVMLQQHYNDALRPVADRKSTRLNSSHVKISYAVFCLKKKKKHAK